MSDSNEKKSDPTPSAIVRDPGGRFVPGAPSPNPTGRAPGLSRRVREVIGPDGAEAVEVLRKIMRGEPFDLGGPRSSEYFPGPSDPRRISYPTVREMHEAATALLDRGFGKPSQGVELSGPGGSPITLAAAGPAYDFARLSPEEEEFANTLVEALAPLLEKATLRPGEERATRAAVRMATAEELKKFQADRAIDAEFKVEPVTSARLLGTK